jgi:ribosomal protein S18 acetylase RimI-like enzyme
MKIKIDVAKLSDMMDIRELNLALFKNYNQYDQTLDNCWTMSEVGKTYFTWAIKSSSARALVARIDGITVGYLVGGKTNKLPARSIGKQFALHNIFVLKEFRSQGVGDLLVNDFLKWARSKNAKSIQVVVSTYNNKGIRFYKKSGFHDYSNTLELDI